MPLSALDGGRLQRLLDARRQLSEEPDLDATLARLLHVARDLTGARFAAFGPVGDPPAPPAGRTPTVEVNVTIGGQAWGTLVLADKATGAFDPADRETAVVLAEWAAAAIDRAQIDASSRHHRLELEQAISRLQATTDIALAVGGETDSGRVLELIVTRGRALVGARAMVILVREGDDLVVAATAGELAPGLAGTRLALSESVAEHVLGTGQPEVVADLSSRVRLPAGALDVTPTTGLFVPLTFRGRDVGVLEAFDRAGAERDFDAHDTALLTSFGASAAIAIATAQTVDTDRLRHSVEATEQERRRWARELHDETLQGLASLRVLLSAARRSGDDRRLVGAVDEALAQVDQEMESLHSLITELRPASLDDIGLAAAIEALGDRTASLQGLVITSTVDLDDVASRLHPDLESTIYRLVQEALTNVVKHAHATAVQIDVTAAAGVVDVSIRDDGDGFDARVPGAGFGLTGMRERAALADGELTIDSTAGGTTIHATLPLRLAYGEAVSISP